MFVNPLHPKTKLLTQQYTNTMLRLELKDNIVNDTNIHDLLNRIFPIHQLPTPIEELLKYLMENFEGEHDTKNVKSSNSSSKEGIPRAKRKKKAPYSSHGVH